MFSRSHKLLVNVNFKNIMIYKEKHTSIEFKQWWI